MILLLVYSLGCVRVIQLALRAGVRPGVWAAAAAILANTVSLWTPAYYRCWVALAILWMAVPAVRQAFERADEAPRGTDDGQRATLAGFALTAVACGEAIIALVGAFIWTMNGPTR